MKEYKLAAWPDLPASYHRTTYRRMLSDLSQRHLSVAQLMASSGASRLEVRTFLQMLTERGLLLERDAAPAPLGNSFTRWLRRALQRETVEA